MLNIFYTFIYPQEIIIIMVDGEDAHTVYSSVYVCIYIIYDDDKKLYYVQYGIYIIQHTTHNII